MYSKAICKVVTVVLFNDKYKIPHSKSTLAVAEDILIAWSGVKT